MNKALIYSKLSELMGEEITQADASEVISPEVVAIGIMVVEIVDLITQTVAQSGILNDIASLQRQYFIALKDQGFDDDQALSILTSFKLPSKK
jgi:hypothetical protein